MVKAMKANVPIPATTEIESDPLDVRFLVCTLSVIGGAYGFTSGDVI